MSVVAAWWTPSAWWLLGDRYCGEATRTHIGDTPKVQRVGTVLAGIVGEYRAVEDLATWAADARARSSSRNTARALRALCKRHRSEAITVGRDGIWTCDEDGVVSRPKCVEDATNAIHAIGGGGDFIVGYVAGLSDPLYWFDARATLRMGAIRSAEVLSCIAPPFDVLEVRA